ncbi:MAG: MipA/OmpV family protein [Burkholderiaceae bacterium]|nr:MipA/OmpV family protein [Burkholderiaceae bacterium]
MSRSFRFRLQLGMLLLGSVLAGAGHAQVVETPRLHYVLGAQISSQPEYAGAPNNKSHLSPLWALQYGRWRISSSGAGQVMGFGEEVQGPGASTDLVKSDALRLGLALRVDSGRSSKDSVRLQGLPDVPRTLRARLFGSYALAPEWLASAAWSQDLLGREGGGILNLDIGYRLRQTRHTEWTAGAGITAGTARNHQSYFGITPAGSVASGLPVFSPGAGLRDVHAGVGFTHALSSRWILFGSAGVSRLLSDAALSPLVHQRQGSSVGLGLAYRCCRWGQD